MKKDLIAVFEYLEREKGIKREIVASAIEESLVAAAQKSIVGASNVSVQIDSRTGEIEVYCEKEIVEKVEKPTLEMGLEEAKELDPDCELGQFIDVLVTPRDFGRIAAQKARQVINQKLRGAERDVIYEEYRHRINDMVSGTIKRFARGNKIIVDLGKVEAVMPMKNYPKTEKYRIGDKVTALLLEVQDTENGGAEVVLTRSHPEFVMQLLIQEVPEIADETVIVEKIVRDPGYRTKLTVRATDSKVDPVGACVGMRGMRIKNIVSEVNEKIDIIPFSEDPITLLQNALDPIEIRKINVSEDDNTVSIVVDDDDYAVAIGKRGMNATLNGRLIGYHLEVQKMSDYNRAMAAQRLQLAEETDDTLNEKITEIKGINSLIMELLIDKGYDTPRALLTVSTDQLAADTGISLMKADEILEVIRKQRMESE